MSRLETDTADYLVSRCENCGMLNVLPRNRTDGYSCADCGGGPLIPMGYAILRQEPTHKMTVQVSVERGELDKLIDDVAAVHKMVDQITGKMKGIVEDAGHGTET